MLVRNHLNVKRKTLARSAFENTMNREIVFLLNFD